MSISALDLFKIGIGPSSSHTVGPMVAAKQFIDGLIQQNTLEQVARIECQMFGSLGATGIGHGTPKAVLLGLMGEEPESVDVSKAVALVQNTKDSGKLHLNSQYWIQFDYQDDLILHRNKSLPHHANGMRFNAYDSNHNLLADQAYYSVGGGFVVDESAFTQPQKDPLTKDQRKLPLEFDTAEDLLELSKQHELSISDIMLKNETAWRSETETRDRLTKIWEVMQECVNNGMQATGTLPGGLEVERRANELHNQLLSRPEQALSDPLSILDWVTLYALAVNEENAGGGRVVTAPTNGAAGIIPAVLHYYERFIPSANQEGIIRFLLTAAAIGILYKKNASISGAEVGCQGEVGSACSMAAGALTEVLGGTPAQVENAAEIAMEHNLGLTCDPIGGLVQVPCIERNAMASVKAIHAARMALRGDGSHFVSLDKVIRTMRDTGRDMQDKYKETARGGLALNVIEVPVNVVEC